MCSSITNACGMLKELPLEKQKEFGFECAKCHLFKVGAFFFDALFYSQPCFKSARSVTVSSTSITRKLWNGRTIHRHQVTTAVPVCFGAEILRVR